MSLRCAQKRCKRLEAELLNKDVVDLVWKSCDKMEVASSYIEFFRYYRVLYPFAECIYIPIDNIPFNSNDVAGGIFMACTKLGLEKIEFFLPLDHRA